MQGVELQDCRVYPYQNQYSDIDNIPIFSTLNLQEGVMLMGLVASGGVSAGTTVLSHVIISHCASSRASRAQGAATIHNTETGERGREGMHSYTQS